MYYLNMTAFLGHSLYARGKLVHQENKEDIDKLPTGTYMAPKFSLGKQKKKSKTSTL